MMKSWWIMIGDNQLQCFLFGQTTSRLISDVIPQESRNSALQKCIQQIFNKTSSSTDSSLRVSGVKFQAAPAWLEPPAGSRSFVLALASHSETLRRSSRLMGKVSKYKSPCVRHTCPNTWCSCKTLHLAVWWMRNNTTLGHRHPRQGGSSGRSQCPLCAGTGSRRSKTSREAEWTTSWRFWQTSHSEVLGGLKGWAWANEWDIGSCGSCGHYFLARKSSRDFPKNLETQSINKTPGTWCIAVSAKWHFSPARKVDGNLPCLLFHLSVANLQPWFHQTHSRNWWVWPHL